MDLPVGPAICQRPGGTSTEYEPSASVRVRKAAVAPEPELLPRRADHDVVDDATRADARDLDGARDGPDVGLGPAGRGDEECDGEP